VPLSDEHANQTGAAARHLATASAGSCSRSGAARCLLRPAALAASDGRATAAPDRVGACRRGQRGSPAACCS
jgi:hypothetical protein